MTIAKLKTEDINRLFDYMTPQERAEAEAIIKAEPKWIPFPGPQRVALDSPAEILFYGGAAGGGKTDLILGAAMTQHQRSVVFRREYNQLKGIKDRADELLAKLGSYNGQHELWKLTDGRRIEFGAVQMPGDVMKYQGRPHDLKAFDEITHFLEAQFRFLIGWMRSSDPKQRCRVICAGNPPMNAEGDWVIKFWAPWLDKMHPRPAAPGELRWFVTDKEGKDLEVDGPGEVEIDGDMVPPVSRTFIRSLVEDNPYLMESGYRRTLAALPEPLRSKMLKGDFTIGQEDDPWQCIPSAWVIAAQDRWTEAATNRRPKAPISALGADIARGGDDRTVLTPRHGPWFGEQLVYPGSFTPDGATCLGLIVKALEGKKASIHIDVIGVGASVYDAAMQSGMPVMAMNGTAATDARDKSNQMGFVNCRAYWWWSLREALDPASGQDLMIPPDRELFADLTAPRWKSTARGIQLESKDDIKKRIGRSTDKGDSLVYAHSYRWQSGTAILEFYANEVALMTAQKETAMPQVPA